MNNEDRKSVERATEPACRINDQPPSHWKANDGWTRHPQTVEEWNWRDDIAGEGSRRSELRLNFAGDRADPCAPDQMALILRIDLLRIMARMHSAEAYKTSKLAQLASKPSLPEWISVPDSQGWWWHWDGDKEHVPFMYGVLTSNTGPHRYFTQNPNSRWCEEYGGLWLKAQEPNLPTEPAESEVK